VKRRTALVLNFILLVGCLCYFFLIPVFAGPIRYNFGDEQEIGNLKEECTEALEPFFTKLAFSGEALPYDKTSSTFYLPLNMEEEKWETGELTSLAEDVSLVFEERFTDTDKKTAIREGKRFRFYAVRGGEYQECYLMATGLPIISIETGETADTGAFGGTAYFWDSASKQNWASSNILEAHIRGNTSRTYPKKGYKLSLKTQDKDGNVVPEKKSLFGLRTDDEWILNAMYSDNSKIRDKLSIDVWNSFGSSVEEFPNGKFGTDFTYVEVFFNQEYWGLYGLMEPVDSKQLDLAKESENKAPEYSYKAIFPQEAPTDSLEQIPEFGESVAGFELKGAYSSINKDSWEPLFSYLELRDLMDDETFAREAPYLTDIDGALNVWIYFQAVLGIDNRAKNMYYVAKQVNQRYKIYFVPWDMDLTWGDCLKEGTGGNIWDVGLFPNLYSERINWTMGDRLVELDVEGSRKRVADTWKDLREGVLSNEALVQSVDNLVHQIQESGALARNEERWPDSNSDADYELFKRMALYRMEILDYYFNGNLEAYMGLGYE
jgi:hypothetical protein